MTAVHDITSCPTCAPIVATPAYGRGVERARAALALGEAAGDVIAAFLAAGPSPAPKAVEREVDQLVDDDVQEDVHGDVSNRFHTPCPTEWKTGADLGRDPILEFLASPLPTTGA